MQIEKNIEDIAVVKEVKNGFVIVEMQRTGSCKSCSMSGLCMGTNNVVLHKIQTNEDFQIGDTVKIYISPGFRIFSSFLIFVFPILTLIFFYLFSYFVLNLSENYSILFSFLGFFLSGVVIYFLDKKLKNKINIKIVAKI